MILSQTEMSSAQVVSEKILEGMRNIKFTLPDGRRLKLGISGGIAIFPVHARNCADLLRAADAALYQAKKHNRGTFQVARGITGMLETQRVESR